MGQRLFDQLTRSGRSEEAWTQDARRLVDQWRDQANRHGPEVSLGDLDCYHDGCTLPVSYANAVAMTTFEQELRRNHQIRWSGYVHRTSAVYAPDGSATATWLVMAPEKRNLERGHP